MAGQVAKVCKSFLRCGAIQQQIAVPCLSSAVPRRHCKMVDSDLFAVCYSEGPVTLTLNLTLSLALTFGLADFRNSDPVLFSYPKDCRRLVLLGAHIKLAT